MTLDTLLVVSGIAFGIWALVILALQWPWSRRAPLRLDAARDDAAFTAAVRGPAARAPRRPVALRHSVRSA